MISISLSVRDRLLHHFIISWWIISYINSLLILCLSIIKAIICIKYDFVSLGMGVVGTITLATLWK